MGVGNLKLSLCMIVRDEEKTLERCLNSVKEFIDEIILIDTGSIDETKQIGGMFGAKIFDYKWEENFAKARNYSFSKASGDYILWLDGDDYVMKEEKEKIINVLSGINKNVDYISGGYIIKRSEEGEVNLSLRRNRIVKREKNFQWVGEVHEFLDVNGNGIYGDFFIEHGKIKSITDRNLQIYRKLELTGRHFQSRELFYYGNELRDNGFYEEAIEKYEEFLKKNDGWIEDQKLAYIKIIECLNESKRIGEIEKYAYKSFELDLPRAEICCALGAYYLEIREYQRAIFWYLLAFECPVDKYNASMQSTEYSTIVPALQLCVCFHRIEKLDVSYFFNELAKVYGTKKGQVEFNN
ncbi:MAG: glycosyltransferase, partial [Sarcina sp.]